MRILTIRNGTPVSRISFGTMQFGGKADAAASRAMFDSARAAGITHFDTAVGYCEGASETLLGQMIKQDRDDLYIATKVGYAGGASKANITRHFDTCRKQLDQDAVDLLYMHRFDDDTPLEETYETLADLQSSGAIRHIGVSNYAAWQVMKAQAVARSLGTKIDVIQPMYNLVKRQAEVEIFPMAQDQKIAIVPYSPLGGGLLTGKYGQGSGGRLTEDPRYQARYDQPWMHQTARDLHALADAQGVHPATLAVAWVAAHPASVSPIISAKSVEQLGPSLAAADFDMDSDLYEKTTQLSISPAPATDRLEEI
ncbi:aldo/keto reductase [Yoonia sediminilitoris]|uniref:Aryl-alcohol dehydrogenase-like predicted oxidoreductase n=1 Tax=Yoonia sediminilitoris TaxID=1286148 RepID=A0A2T6KPV9_9RHOB|nr:aldo/keto reductase [Yoonia sediminilitoris]PUB18582.1 aryl-alcohol dehydrogenase-like predicted oxidoreductase [Yoonia sediminilitoris]RCW98750.1 aryl-alcohol dehydrogenase-like predicted oxidoreductase [Yoonia sediminilitoris]